MILTEDEVELLTTPTDLADYKDAIIEGLYKANESVCKGQDMAKNTDNSIKLLVLYDILLKSTDEEHALSTKEIIEELQFLTNVL